MAEHTPTQDESAREGGAAGPDHATALDAYRTMRDFSRTAEPAGGTATPRPERPRYLIQKHAATRLHYDLRLEVDGVLKSWAVPKGPSLDPGERRLAVQTEDHPLEYGDFEGIIPEGQYGGGTVMLWDVGWWEVDEDWIREKGSGRARAALTNGPAAAIEQGELKFKLHGKKLQGSWVLVKMKGRGDKNWLLIKHRDATADEERDVIREEPESALSERSLDQIAEDAKAGDSPVWTGREDEVPSGEAVAAALSPQASRPELTSDTFELDGKTVEFSHPARTYFPEIDATKGEVLAYYEAVAPLLVPHLKGRPLMLERYPQGVEAEHFYQKNVPEFFPDWLTTFDYRTERRVIHHAVVQDAADLLYLANQGTLTFHAFMSRTDDIEHPDLMVIDLDPPKEESGDEAYRRGFRQAVDAALVIRERFAAHDVELLVKTSGKRGIHLAIPLGGDMDYADARKWLDAFLDQIARAHPEKFTRELRKAKRQGRVFLEALRMSFGATVVPPYVVRPTPVASVSMPVTWEELEQVRDPREFNIRTALPRVEQRGDLWSLVAHPGTQ